jgi:hypothetical protein
MFKNAVNLLHPRPEKKFSNRDKCIKYQYDYVKELVRKDRADIIFLKSWSQSYDFRIYNYNFRLEQLFKVCTGKFFFGFQSALGAVNFYNLQQFTAIYSNLQQFTAIYSNLQQFTAIYSNLQQFTAIYSNLQQLYLFSKRTRLLVAL